MEDDVGLDQDSVCGGGGKQLYSRYILKVEPTKFDDRLGMKYEEQVKVRVFGRMELPFTEIGWSQLGGVRIKVWFGYIESEIPKRHIQMKMWSK